LGGDSSFDAAPVVPVVVFGIELGLPLAPPVVVTAEPPSELIPDDAPVGVDFFIASEFEFVIAEAGTRETTNRRLRSFTAPALQQG
jgi:hypothetical protein